MSDVAVYLIVTGAVVVIAILIALAFARGWISKLKIRHRGSELSAEAGSPSAASARTDVNRSGVRKSKIKTRAGRTKINRSKIKDSQIENG